MNLIVKKYGVLTLLNIIFFFSSYGQTFEPYAWENDRKLTELTQEEKGHGLYYIKLLEKYHYEYDPNTKNLLCYITNHTIIRVNNDEALNKSNQLYIPMRNTLELTQVKARAIGKEGKVINFDENNIKELQEDESGYKILAIEGAEVGGEIEYFYTRKTSATVFLTKKIQSGSPIKSYTFSLNSPKNLEYDFKVYNDTAKVKQIDDSKEFNQYRLQLSNIPALLNEGFSAFETNKKRLEAKLAYNSQTSIGRLNTWGDAGKRIYELIYSTNSDEQKAVNKFIKKMNYTGNPVEVLKKYEHYIKTNYSYEEEAGPDASNIDFIIKNKYGNARGLAKLYAAILEKIDLAHELVLTSDRFKNEFDPEFDTWNYLGEYLIYLNDTKQFLAPKDAALRLGTISSEFIGTPALFIRPEKIQNFVYPVGHIEQIPAPSYKDNLEEMVLNVTFNKNFEQNDVSVSRTYTGYTGSYYKSAALFLDAERKKEFLDEILKYLAKDAEIEKIEISEANSDHDTWHKPFSVKGKFSTSSYIESAGDVILFKVGQLIGAQSELYQEDDRVLKVVNGFNHGYIRKIKVKIPEHYKIQNPEDLIINKEVFEGDKLIFNFKSSYTLDKGDLEIIVDEFYDQLTYPAEKFEAFRDVINAAADWNKIVLVLEP